MPLSRNLSTTHVRSVAGNRKNCRMFCRLTLFRRPSWPLCNHAKGKKHLNLTPANNIVGPYFSAQPAGNKEVAQS